jgi:hypothetical protein
MQTNSDQLNSDLCYYEKFIWGAFFPKNVKTTNERKNDVAHDYLGKSVVGVHENSAHIIISPLSERYRAEHAIQNQSHE